MSSPIEESPIINSDIEHDVTSSRRNLVESEPGIIFMTLRLKPLIGYTKKISYKLHT